jgi:predicted nuclease of predicted toxin-antitoxin system
MSVKLDENLPVAPARELGGLGHDVDTVPEEGLVGADDESVWAAAQRESRFLVTQDLRFSDARRYPSGTHAGILLVRLHQPSRRRIVDRLPAVAQAEPLDEWSGCFVTLTGPKIRVMRG